MKEYESGGYEKCYKENKLLNYLVKPGPYRQKMSLRVCKLYRFRLSFAYEQSRVIALY